MPDENNQPPAKNPDAEFISGVATSVPVADMMGSWCAATVQAQGEAAKQTANFIKETAFDADDNMRMVKTSMNVGDLHYDEEVPLLSFIPIPAMEIKESVFGVDMEITTSKASKSSLDGSAGGSADVQVGWGFVSAKVHVEGKFSSSKENTHKQDASAKVHAQITMGPAEVPIGVKKYLDRLQTVSDAYTNEILKKAAQKNLPDGGSKEDGKAA